MADLCAALHCQKLTFLTKFLATSLNILPHQTHVHGMLPHIHHLIHLQALGDLCRGSLESTRGGRHLHRHLPALLVRSCLSIAGPYHEDHRYRTFYSLSDDAIPTRFSPVAWLMNTENFNRTPVAHSTLFLPISSFHSTGSKSLESTGLESGYL